jgi:hypothetical protein
VVDVRHSCGLVEVAAATGLQWVDNQLRWARTQLAQRAMLGGVVTDHDL